jgi:hypothetical protein
VLDSFSSPITKRFYNLGLDEFFAWYTQEPRRGFTRPTVNAWRGNGVSERVVPGLDSHLPLTTLEVQKRIGRSLGFQWFPIKCHADGDTKGANMRSSG